MDRTAKSALGGIESRVTNAVLNYAASLVAMLLAYWYYTHASRYHIDLLDARLFIGSVEMSFPQVLLWLILLFAIAMVPYYLLCPDIRSEARVAAALAIDCWHNGRCARFGADEKQALLTLLLKVFFIPLMVNWTITHTAGVLNHFHELTNTVAQPNVSLLAMLNGGLYLMLFHLLMTIDLLCFTVGYMIELPRLNNQIRSVDPTASGWLVCLLCYPPFNQSFGLFFPWHSPDFPAFAQPDIHVAINCLILLAVGIYAWSSVSLGWRASNLTNRGIVESGPYAWVRHPAYTAKNVAWWLAGLPLLVSNFGYSVGTGLFTLFCFSAWTFIYVLRATTEERHLLMGNNGYAEYQLRVRWRFIPRVI